MLVVLNILQICLLSINSVQTHIDKTQARKLFKPKSPEPYPESISGGFEGDIELSNSPIRKNGLLTRRNRWENGRIPYEIIGPYTDKEIMNLGRAFTYYKRTTCIRFVPKTVFDADYVKILNDPNRCLSYVGRKRGPQTLLLSGGDCFRKMGTILHELMHTIGFFHEQNRYDRDQHVTIHFENVKRGYERNFEKTVDHETTSSFGVPYDIQSVMHYGPRTFSKNGLRTISAKNDASAEMMGQRSGLSRKDINKINRMYCSN